MRNGKIITAWAALAIIAAAPTAANAQTTAPREPRSCQQLHEETNKCEAGMRSCDQRVVSRLEAQCQRACRIASAKSLSTEIQRRPRPENDVAEVATPFRLPTEDRGRFGYRPLYSCLSFPVKRRRFPQHPMCCSCRRQPPRPGRGLAGEGEGVIADIGDGKGAILRSGEQLADPALNQTRAARHRLSVITQSLSESLVLAQSTKMTLDLTELEALVRLLKRTLANDRFLLAPRLDPLKAILANPRVENPPVRRSRNPRAPKPQEPRPPFRVYEPPRATARQRRPR